jgi:hypothetical protein
VSNGVKKVIGVRIRYMVFNATFNNISIISWRSVLFVEETAKKNLEYNVNVYLCCLIAVIYSLIVLSMLMLSFIFEIVCGL